MTGAGAATLAATGPAAAPSARSPMRSDSTSHPADAAAAAPARADGGTAVDQGSTERVARQDDHGEDAASVSTQSFAQLLVQPPPAPPPAPTPPADAGAHDADATAGTTLPEHLLALLDGSWSRAAASPPSATAAAPLTAQGAQYAPGLSAAAALAASAAAESATAANPALPMPDADAAVAASSLAASALEIAATARDATAAQADPGFEAPAAGIAGTTPLAASRPQAAAPALPPLPMPADPDAGFDEGFGTRLVWMAEQRVGHAEIRLNPEHVGPIGVRVQLDGEQVRAEFHSAHADVRQAIEASLPRLREMLGQHGLQLGQADVGQGQAGQDGSDARPAGAGRGAAGTGEEMRPPQAPLRARGLVDEYV